MEMERINENTIRVLIGNDDLDKRGITVLDLLGNHKQIESFFYSILEEVDKDHQFQNNDAVTFQVLPNQNGLELFISKDVDMSDEDEPLLGSGDGHEKHDQVSNILMNMAWTTSLRVTRRPMMNLAIKREPLFLNLMI